MQTLEDQLDHYCLCSRHCRTPQELYQHLVTWPTDLLTYYAQRLDLCADSKTKHQLAYNIAQYTW